MKAAEVGRAARPAGLGLGLLAAGAAAGWLGERFLVRRGPGSAALSLTGFGTLHAEPRLLRTDDDVELYVEVDEAGPQARYAPLTVVFVHGYALNLDCWHFQRQALHGDVRSVYLDLRGHGRSGLGSRESHTVERLGADLRELLATVAPHGPVVLVGHSMGGIALMAVAEQEPELFQGPVVGVGLLCTSSGGLTGPSLGLPRGLATVVRKAAPGTLRLVDKVPGGVVTRVRRSGSDLGHLFTRFYAFASHVPAGLTDFAGEMLAATPLEVLADYLPEFDTHDKGDDIPAFREAASLVVGARQDLMIPVEHSVALSEALPDAELVIADPGGHLVLLEQPDQVTEALRRLFDRSLEVARSRGLA